MFDSVVANKATVDMLTRAVGEGRLPHALIIEGAAGSGRHTIAFSLASALAGGDAETEHRMREWLCPDVRLIGCADGRKTIGVETVRELTRQAYITSNEFSFRMFIIEDAELMTVSAQNAFLKLFEEPPQGVYFVLLCLSASMLLPTVRSRAQLLRTERCRDEDIRSYLTASSPRAATLARDGAAELDRIISSAEGSIGEALRLLARSGRSDKAREISDGVIRAVASRSGVAIMLSVSRLSSDRSEAADILELVLDGLRELLFARCCDDGQDCALPNASFSLPQLAFGGRSGNASATAAEMGTDLADSLSTRELCECMAAVGETRDRILHNANVRLALTSAALRLRHVMD